MYSGNYVLILHTHLPWVLNHGKWPHGEDWLTEAVAECYIPLLNVFNELLEEGITPNVTLDISPVLCEQLENKNFAAKFVEYCDLKISGAETDEHNFKNWGYHPHHIWLATYWKQWYSDRKNEFLNKYNSSIIKSLKTLQDKNAIEIMTCGATHGYFPLLGYDKSINLQVTTAVENYKKHFGRNPRGTWLPECAYRPSYEWHSYIPVDPFNSKRFRPGIEQFLAENNIEYFVIDEELIENSKPVGTFQSPDKNNFKDINSPDFQQTPWNFDKSPLRLHQVASNNCVEYGTSAAYVRHHDISMQVWSGQVGYPGEPDYLDFHKKQLGSMLRYWRVTDNKADMAFKTLYHPDWTKDKIDHQAMHFIHHIENTSNHFNKETGKLATVCTPFDTELFGHWWFEGPQFIKAVIKGLHNSPYINSKTASANYDIVKPNEVVSIPEGSWGENNNHDVWSNNDNTWTWEAIYNDELRLNNLINSINKPIINTTLRRILTQAMRELMLLHSSDWQFLIYTQSAKDYAEQRFTFHHSDFNRLCDLAESFNKNNSINENELRYISETEERNAIFPELQIEWWDDLKFEKINK